MAICNISINHDLALSFVPELWVPDDDRLPPAHATSQYMIRELSDGLVIWRRAEDAHHAAPWPYVATCIGSIVAVQQNADWRREHTDVLWAVLDSPVARLRTPGSDQAMVFDTLDELRGRLAWSERRMRYWRVAERLRGEADRAAARLAADIWRQEQERIPPERRTTINFSALLHEPGPDEEGC